MKTTNWFILCLGLVLAPCLTRDLLAAEGPETFTVSEFSFKRPAAWEWIKSTSSMRAAQLSVPNKNGGDPAEVVFFYFGPGNGGGTQANVQRWLGQFQEPKDKLNAKTEELNQGARRVTYVQAEGTYLSGPPSGQKVPKPGYALVGAILESNRGNVFVKMTGPSGLTKGLVGDFKKMIESELK